MSARKALITGAGGEMGHLLVPALVKAGYEVVAFDLRPLPEFLASQCLEAPVLSVNDLPAVEDLFARVIVDSPPVIPVRDPVMLVPEMDGVMLVVMAGVTPRELVARARDVLHDVDANILGVIVNNHAEVLTYYYDHKYYGYRDAVSATVETSSEDGTAAAGEAVAAGEKTDP